MLRHDALAAPAGLAGGRRVAAVAPGALAAPGGRRADRLEPGQRGRLAGAGKRGGAGTGPNPVDRGKPGAHHHLVTDRRGVPLAAFSTAANVNEGTVLARLVDTIPALKQPHGRPGRPRRRPAKLHADKGYASRANRALLRRRHIAPRIARKGIESSARLGRHRWVAERSFAWLHRNRRLLIRFERDDALHQAFLALGCALVCWQLLTHAT